MCLYTKQKDPIVLDKDLIVWKALRRKCWWIIIWYTSPIYDEFKWIRHKLYKSALLSDGSGYTRGQYIENGFHAFINEMDCKYEWTGKYYAIKQMLIPKGALVYYSDNGKEIASNQMKLL